MAGLLADRAALVVGVANKRSISWAIADALAKQGARVALTYQGERVERDVRKLAGTLGEDTPVLALDVTDGDQIAAATSEAADALGGLDILVHGVAFATAEDLAGRFTDTSREGWSTALEISAYSLVELARTAEPYMNESGHGSIMTLSYLGGVRATPGYNVMGAAKAALESSVRYLAWDLGEAAIRVNAISAGPVRTLAARGIPGFSTMADSIAERAPLRRGIDGADDAGAAVFLASDLSRGVTGTTLYVDAGYHAMGL
jgi:enoyl-[acyl-carrier protein] reductase I